MGKIILFLSFIFFGLGSWWFWTNSSHVREVIGSYIENGDFLTLEARYTPEQIMQNHQQELLLDSQHTYQEPSIKFYPYLLMEIKYTEADKKTREGILLWGLVDGEIVLDTESWEKTHGFEDAILANANRQDLKILLALAKYNGILTREQLFKELHQEANIVDPWIAEAIDKQLIIQKGNQLQLHFQNPKILVKPHTKIHQHLVTKPYNHAQRVEERYYQNQIEKIAKAAFNDLNIRRITKIYIPVYSIEVLKPDGSILTRQWNAVNGQQMTPKYMLRD